jgi:hypothetical protein
MKHKIKPRNPFVVLAKFRKAGFHEKPGKALRRRDKLTLCKVVKQLPEHWQKRSFLEFTSANASCPLGVALRPLYHHDVRPGLLQKSRLLRNCLVLDWLTT